MGKLLFISIARRSTALSTRAVCWIVSVELSGLMKSGYFGDNSFPYVKCLTASREMDMVP
ncbi:hypothetical protein B296_00058527 [Ensete ventricosum]|uniref:Uncharacterized protein n=1 Tax=Ensete ventricosum TaxID=4639 RepID=A0A426XLT8_ENSVE|nr:hypothetical protein B296_00058527 [Ensete ventricosum]